MRADLKTKMLSDEDALITGAKRVALIEESLLEIPQITDCKPLKLSRFRSFTANLIQDLLS